MATPCPPMPDHDLVARIRAGDAGAFEQLFRAHYEELCDLAARLLGSDALAEEAVQEAFLHLWQIRERWEIGTTLHGYLWTMVRNRVFNQLRRRQLERRWAPAVASDDDVIALYPEARHADDDVTSRELADAIRRGVAQLPPRCREAFLLRREQNLSYAEIAAIMQTAPRTVEAQIRTALKMLRVHLRDWL